MKYLLIFFIIMVLVFNWRSSRTEAKLKPKVKPGGTAAGPQEMIACTHCGLHVPSVDALQGTAGVYCSAAHLRLRET
jgi:uncharacterized protein